MMRRIPSVRRVLPAVALALTAALLAARLPAARASAVSLIDATVPATGWTFDNGQEFPGATGALTAAATKHDNQPTLHLHGDFTKGGNYVQMSHTLHADPATLAFWIKAPGEDHLTVRVNDSSGQCHQINFKLDATDNWQHVIFPLARFFANRNTPDAVSGILKYESWSGAKDGKWHGPATGLAILIGKHDTKRVVDIWLSGIELQTAPAESSAATVIQPVSLEEVLEGDTIWTSNNGQEFAGAVVHLDVVKDGPAKGDESLRLMGDFTKGGQYVDTEKNLKDLNLPDIADIHLQYKTSNVQQIGVRLVDNTGQCHQKKGIAVTADGQWHVLTLEPKSFEGGEHWGGANDGQWHGPADLIAIVVGPTDTEKKPSILLADATADTITTATLQPAAFKQNFDATTQLPADWKSQGDVSIDITTGFKSKNALLLRRSTANVNQPVSATGPTFKLTPGDWQIDAAGKCNLVSPDESYQGNLSLEELNDANAVVDTVSLLEIRKDQNWLAVSKKITIPAGITGGRFVAEIKKSTGKFWIDELSAAFLAPTPRKDDRIAAIMFNTTQMGNLLYPTDSKKVTITVVATKPLKPEQMKLSWILRDYWGAEIAPASEVTLTRAGRDGSTIHYTADIDLAKSPIEQGRYYEIHASIPQPGDQDFQNYTSFAIVPEALTKKYPAQDIPFTSRDWDNRLNDYITLSDRLGLRIGGVWGGWNAAPPYDPQAPQLDHCVQLNMGVLSGAESHAVEEKSPGYQVWLKDDCKALRDGCKAWLEKYGKVRPLIIDLGNEPHVGNAEQIKEDVEAYKAIYETVKAYDPTIMVLGTSVGPQEDFFKAGFQNYCDAYDFHVYESYNDVKRALERYQVLFAKYHCAKPIWSTELGLNAQGMTRQAVTIEMIKKAAVFFANGGANMSWFDLLYPDPEAKMADDNASAFNVFDCRYAPRYAPKLDALSYYNIVNAICIKKFVDHKMYDNNVDDYLFKDKDGNALQILWTEKGRTDIGLPLQGVQDVESIAIDGRISHLNANGKALTLTAGDSPIMLLYKTDASTLADKLDPPAASITSPIAAVIKGDQTPLTVSLNGLAADAVSLNLPAGWTSRRTAADDHSATFTMAMPIDSDARAADLQVDLKDSAGHLVGQLTGLYPVAGRLTLHVEPLVESADSGGGVRLILHNNGTQPQVVNWSAALLGQSLIAAGKYGPLSAADAYFAGPADGSITVAGNATSTIDIPMAGVDPLAVYRVKAIATDASGRSVDVERFLAGFVPVPYASSPITLDGSLDDPAWKAAPVEKIDQAKQMLLMDAQAHPWGGPKDLSATIRYLWDAQNLYIGVQVTDDIFSNPMTDDSLLWNQDGLQILVDPARDSAEKPGKYDYSIGISKAHGPMAWRHLSGTPSLGTGAATDLTVTAKRATDGTGGVTYEIAIPWTSLAPFKTAPGADLGLTLALNEDDGHGRHGYMNWFADVGSKVVDDVGDLVLQKQGGSTHAANH